MILPDFVSFTEHTSVLVRRLLTKEACLMFPDDCQLSHFMKELRQDRTFMSWA